MSCKDGNCIHLLHIADMIRLSYQEVHEVGVALEGQHPYEFNMVSHYEKTDGTSTPYILMAFVVGDRESLLSIQAELSKKTDELFSAKYGEHIKHEEFPKPLTDKEQ